MTAIKERLKNYLEFLWVMSEKETKVRYKRAVFGFLWVVLNPALQMLIIGVVFSLFIKIPNYFLFLFTGLLPWQFFSLSLSKATPSIVNERSLLQKAKFPVEAVPVSIILSNFFNMIVSLVIFLPILFISVGPSIASLFLTILALLWLLVLTIGLSLLTVSFNVKYRDINFFVQTILILWFYATPVLYNLSLVPESLNLLFSLNPLTSIFEILHYSLLGRGVIEAKIVIANIVLSLVIIFLGVFAFKRERKYFVDWL